MNNSSPTTTFFWKSNKVPLNILVQIDGTLLEVCMENRSQRYKESKQSQRKLIISIGGKTLLNRLYNLKKESIKGKLDCSTEMLHRRTCLRTHSP